MRNICSSPKYAAGGFKIQYQLSVRLKGTLAIGSFNLISQPGIEPTVRIDNCENQSLFRKRKNAFIAEWLTAAF
jgi:hypothetical protein